MIDCIWSYTIYLHEMCQLILIIIFSFLVIMQSMHVLLILLLNLYNFQESKNRFDSDSEFKKHAYSAVVKLQSGDPEIHKAWSLICAASRKGTL